MARACQLTRAGGTLAATWALEPDALVVSPQGAPPEAWRIDEIAGVGGDEYAIELKLGAEAVRLSKLGADGASLLASLRRDWPPRRAQALRLSGGGAPPHVMATVSLAGGPARPATLLLGEVVLLVAPHGDDVEPVFLALVASAEFDEGAQALTLAHWDGAPTVVTKLAGQAREFTDALRARRAVLATEAAQVLSAFLPTLGTSARTALAAAWLPGRALPLARLEALAPGFGAAFAASWLGAVPRRQYADALLALAKPEGVWLGYARPGTRAPEASAPAEAPAADAEAPAAAAATYTGPLLWLLLDAGTQWFLEAPSEQDWATYRFAAGADLPGLATRLMCAAQFSREALYLPLEALVGVRGEYAIAARDLPFLRALRERFRGRVIHASVERWRAGLAAT